MSSPPELSKQRLRLWLRMLRATRRIENELREHLRINHGTTLPRFDVLAALYRNQDGLKMSELGRVLMVSNGNITGIIDRLVDDGWVTRKPISGDRRATRVALTHKGREQFHAMAAEHEAWVNNIMAGLDASELAELLPPLERLARRAG
jgi:DNA-binding MarR family transcriptional regulator